MPKLLCEGWWEQAGYGRQSMNGLVMDFADGGLTGNGEDVIGPFVMIAVWTVSRSIFTSSILDSTASTTTEPPVAKGSTSAIGARLVKSVGSGRSKSTLSPTAR